MNLRYLVDLYIFHVVVFCAGLYLVACLFFYLNEVGTKLIYKNSSSFELDVILCSVSVIPLQHRNCSVCMFFVGLGHHNG